MRLPTKDEFAAFESEEIQVHGNCRKTGVCTHMSALLEVCEMLSRSVVFGVSLTTLGEQLLLEVEPSEALLHFFTYAFFDGMQLGFKLSEKDVLEKLAQ